MKSKNWFLFGIGQMFILAFFAAKIEVDTGVQNESLPVLAALVLIICTVVGTVLWYRNQPENVEARKKKQEAREKRIAEEWERKAGYLIDNVIILGKCGSTIERGGLAGAIVGGLFGGRTGSIIGGMMATGTRDVIRFKVQLRNGITSIEEAEVGSKRYNELMQYVSWEDLE